MKGQRVWNRKPTGHLYDEPLACDNVVYSAYYMFKSLLKEIHDEQMETFGVTGLFDKQYVYLNNYCLTIDTMFRLLLKIGKLCSTIIRRFNAKRMFIICDITKRNIHKLNYTRKYIPRKYIVKDAIHALQRLSKFISEDETENYDVWEQLLSVECPSEYCFSIHHTTNRIDNYYRHERYSKQFMLWVSYLQMGFHDEVLYEIVLYALRQLKLNRISGIHMITCSDDQFDNLLAKLSIVRTVVFTNKPVKMKGIFYEHQDEIYCCDGPKNSMNKDEPITADAKTVLKHAKKRLLDLYDVCEQWNQGMILDMNSAYGLNIYEKMPNVLLRRELYTIRQERIVADEDYAWLCKDAYLNTIPSWIQSFNILSKAKIIEK